MSELKLRLSLMGRQFEAEGPAEIVGEAKDVWLKTFFCETCTNLRDENYRLRMLILNLREKLPKRDSSGRFVTKEPNQ